MLAFGEKDQCSADLVKFAAKISPESIVDVYGIVKKVDQPIQACTQGDVEIWPTKVFVVSAANPVLPFQIADASRFDPEDKGQDNDEKEEEKKDGEEDGKQVRVMQKARLDNRWIDLRTPANHAIFRLQSKIGQFFRQYFIDRDFVEIHSPKIIPGVSEGGSQVFRLNYFGQPCCLAQSPQLYKQMAVTGDLFKVFEVGSVFRAEDSNTHRYAQGGMIRCIFVKMSGYRSHFYLSQHNTPLLLVSPLMHYVGNSLQQRGETCPSFES